MTFCFYNGLLCSQQKNDKSKIEVLKKKAVKSASEYNAMFNRNRKDERRAYFDIHSFVSVHLLIFMIL